MGWLGPSLSAVFLLVGQSTFQSIALPQFPPSTDLYVQLPTCLSFCVLQISLSDTHMKARPKHLVKKIFPHLILVFKRRYLVTAAVLVKVFKMYLYIFKLG